MRHRLAVMLACSILLSSATYREPVPVRYSIPSIPALSFPYVQHERLQALYQAANTYNIPAHYLAAVYFAESSCGRNTRHSNAFDTGDFGLHELAEIHAERVESIGREYDARKFEDSVLVAAMVLSGHYDALHDWDLSFTAYHKGRLWTYKNGVHVGYIGMIRGYLELPLISGV